jgi:hypothetical protein
MTGKLKACGTWAPHTFNKGERTLSEHTQRTLSCNACSSETAAEAVLCLRWDHKEGGLVQSARLSSRKRCVALQESGALHVRRCAWLWRRTTGPVGAPQALRLQAERDLSWPIARERPEGEMGGLTYFLWGKETSLSPATNGTIDRSRDWEESLPCEAETSRRRRLLSS